MLNIPVSLPIHVRLFQPVQRAISCVPQDCVWRRVDAVMAWTTARMRAMRSTAVSRLTSYTTLLNNKFDIMIALLVVH